MTLGCGWRYSRPYRCSTTWAWLRDSWGAIRAMGSGSLKPELSPPARRRSLLAAGRDITGCNVETGPSSGSPPASARGLGTPGRGVPGLILLGGSPSPAAPALPPRQPSPTPPQQEELLNFIRNLHHHHHHRISRFRLHHHSSRRSLHQHRNSSRSRKGPRGGRSGSAPTGALERQSMCTLPFLFSLFSYYLCRV